jgi:hypothetical protein
MTVWYYTDRHRALHKIVGRVDQSRDLLAEEDEK